MDLKEYNGWRNYATWRVNLEVFDGQRPDDMFGETFGEDDLARLSECLKEYMEAIIENYPEGIVRDYADAFLDDVDWYEIAKNMVAE